MDEIKRVNIGTVKEWRDWLEKNHDKETKVALVSHKKHTGKPSISHKEAMHEAICFGWIDTTIKKLDEDRYIRHFSRRNKNSRWSNATLGYAKDLIKQGKMTSHGLVFYKEGLQKPVIDLNLGKNPDTPKDLVKELSKNKNAKLNFESLAPSYKRTYIHWIERAKMPETRTKRINEVVKRMAQGKKKFLD